MNISFQIQLQSFLLQAVVVTDDAGRTASVLFNIAVENAIKVAKHTVELGSWNDVKSGFTMQENTIFNVITAANQAKVDLCFLQR